MVSLGHSELTHWGLPCCKKMDVIMQTTITIFKSFSWLKIFVFGFKFHWNLLKKNPTRIRWWLGTKQAMMTKDAWCLVSLLGFNSMINNYHYTYDIVNSLAPGRVQRNFRKVIFQLILVTDGWSISSKIALKWMPMDLTDGKSTLVQVMAWCRQATSHYLSQCWPRSLSPHCFTRPQ